MYDITKEKRKWVIGVAIWKLTYPHTTYPKRLQNFKK